MAENKSYSQYSHGFGVQNLHNTENGIISTVSFFKQKLILTGLGALGVEFVFLMFLQQKFKIASMASEITCQYNFGIIYPFQIRRLDLNEWPLIFTIEIKARLTLKCHKIGSNSFSKLNEKSKYKTF